MDADIAWDECIPDLPLDTQDLPPLNALSSSSDSSLHQINLLDSILTFDTDQKDHHHDKLSHLSPLSPLTPLTSLTPPSPESDFTHPESLSDCTANSATSIDSRPTKPLPPSHTSTTRDDTPAPTSSHNELVLELTTRLGSATSETTALRKRLACLSQENRSLRAALDHANARLIAVAQAAAAHPPSTTPLVVTLTQLSSNVAHNVSGALTVSDTHDDSPRDRKKRKRVSGAAATTMACVMFMWGAFVGTPGLLKGSTSAFRSDGNLPAVWKGDSTSSAVAPVVSRVIKEEDTAWQPNCVRVLQQLPDGTEKLEDTMAVDVEDNGSDHKKKDDMFVDMHDEAAANVVAHSDSRDPRHPEYSYVLCRDTDAAIDSVKACANKVKNGEPCGQPHTISLILPASAAGLDDNGTKSIGEPDLAEVQCSILSVARIPSPKVETSSMYGRIIAAVPETGTVIAQ